ncbi:unnamed protein product, partial [Pleuronectes platessa]
MFHAICSSKSRATTGLCNWKWNYSNKLQPAQNEYWLHGHGKVRSVQDPMAHSVSASYPIEIE